MELRRTRFWVLSLKVLSLACLLAISGCGAPREAGPSLSADPGTAAATSPPVPTPDPRPTPASSTGPARNIPRPVLPEVAKQNTKEGFEAFTQYWFDTVTYARETGDVTPLQEASQASCKMCQFQIDKAVQIHADGGWSVGPKRTVREFGANMVLDPNKNAVAHFILEEFGSINYARDGSVSAQHPAGIAVGSQVIYAHHDGAKWTTFEAGRA